MQTTMKAPEWPEKPEARAAWETDPDAWKGEDPEEEEAPADAVNRLLEEVAVL